MGSTNGRTGKAAFLEKLARAQRQVADEGHAEAEQLRVRAEKNDAVARKLRG